MSVKCKASVFITVEKDISLLVTTKFQVYLSLPTLNIEDPDFQD